MRWCRIASADHLDPAGAVAYTQHHQHHSGLATLHFGHKDRDIEVVTVSGTGTVVMVSVIGAECFTVMVFGIETWRFPALEF